jgi:hypothetical protein
MTKLRGNKFGRKKYADLSKKNSEFYDAGDDTSSLTLNDSMLSEESVDIQTSNMNSSYIKKHAGSLSLKKSEMKGRRESRKNTTVDINYIGEIDEIGNGLSKND